MSTNSVAPGAQQKRFAAYLDRLAQAAGHLDRASSEVLLHRFAVAWGTQECGTNGGSSLP